MKKTNLTILTLALITILPMSLTVAILPIVQGVETHGHYDINNLGTFVVASRCDHLTGPPPYGDPDNAFTGCGIMANFSASYETYDNATYMFMRGYGGIYETPCTWTCEDHSMMCGHRVDGTTTYMYDSRKPVFIDGIHKWDWDGHYQPDKNITRLNINAETVGAYTGTYFENTTNSNHLIWISSTINAAHMYADNVITMDYDF